MKKTLLFFAALLCTASAWAGAGFFGTEAVSPLKLKVDDNAKSYTWNSSGVSAIALGEIKSLSITSYAVQVWKDGGNICSSKMQYRVYKTSETAGDWQDITGTWKSENGKNQVWGTKTDANKDVTPAAPGEYKLEIQFISTGSENSTDDCTSTFTLNNGGKYYTINFTIPTPSVPYVLFDNVPTTVEAGTEITLSATSENFSGEVSYAYSVKEPDAADFTTIEGTSYTPTTVGTYTLKVVATAGEESAEKEMKLTVKAAAIDITIRVQIPTGMTGWDYSVAPYLYNWKEEDGIAGNFVAMTSEDDNWYSATVHAATINFIVVNGDNWDGGDARQTVNVEGVTASGCYTLGNASGKKSVTSTICPSTEPSVVFDGVPSTAIAGEAITLTSTYQNFSTEPTITYSVKAPDAADFTTIEGTSYTPTTVGTYTLKVVATAGEESAENTLNVTVTTKYYLAGSGIEGLDWNENKMPMYDNMITFENVAAGTKISFKVIGETWYGIGNIDTDKSSEGVEGDDNIEITISSMCDVTIQVNESDNKITVTGDFGGVVEITSYTVAATKELLGTTKDFDETATANDMVETAEGSKIWKLTKENVALEAKTYEYKVVSNRTWNINDYPSVGNNTLEIKVAGNYTVTFTLDVTAGTLNANAVRTDVTPTSIDNAAAVSVYAENGTIYAEGAMRIYTISGIDVTEQNGQLQGIYVVKTSGKITKVVVR